MTITTTFFRLGDFIVCLPMVSWLYKMTGEKTHFVFSKHFSPHVKLEKILLYQEFTKAVSYIDVPIVNPLAPWMFVNNDPSKFGIEIDGRNINLGFYEWPPGDLYIGKFWARFFGLGFDDDYVLKCPPVDCPLYDNVWIETDPHRDTYKALPKIIPQGAVELKHSDPMEINMNLALKAKNVWTTGGGFAVMMDLTGKEMIIHKTKAESTEGDRRGFKNHNKHRYIWL